jgi:putative membrane protein
VTAVPRLDICLSEQNFGKNNRNPAAKAARRECEKIFARWSRETTGPEPFPQDDVQECITSITQAHAMKSKFIIAVSIFLSAGPALAQSVTEKAGVNSALGISPSTPDFVKEAAIGDMFEIQSSKLAEVKPDAPTKAFAEKMITDHTKTTDEIKKLSKTPIPTQMDSSHQAMLDNLTKLNERDFTKNYHDDQVTAHKQAYRCMSAMPRAVTMPI